MERLLTSELFRLDSQENMEPVAFLGGGLLSWVSSMAIASEKAEDVGTQKNIKHASLPHRRPSREVCQWGICYFLKTNGHSSVLSSKGFLASGGGEGGEETPINVTE